MIYLNQILLSFSLPLELLTGAIISLYHVNKNYRHIILIILGYLLAIILPIGLSYITYNISFIADNLFLLSMFFSIFSYFSIVLFVLLNKKIKILEAFYITNCSYLNQHFVHSIYEIILIFLGQENNIFLCAILFTINYVIAGFTLYPKLMEGYENLTKKGRDFITTLSVLSIAIILSSLARSYQEDGKILYGIILVYSMIFCFYCLYDQINKVLKTKMEEEYNLQQQVFSKYKDQYQLQKENIDLINHKCHDLKHQISALKNIENSSLRNEYIANVEKSIMIYDSIISTGNEILDTLLSEKNLYCEANKIKLNIVADGKCIAFIDPIDLYTLFGNALDNAFECVNKFDIDETKWVNCSVHQKNNLVFIQFENSYQGELKINNNNIKTSKNNEGYHGFGLKSMETIAKKYNGYMNIDTSNHIFLLQFIIPIK